jgi:hypothetical protein
MNAQPQSSAQPTESPLVQRLRGWAEAALAMEAGKPWQYWQKDEWLTPIDQSRQYLEMSIESGYLLRPAPEPVTHAWTLDTAPANEWFGVRYKHGGKDNCLIGQWRPDGVYIVGWGVVGYEQLHDDWLRSDGSVCGTVEGGK